MSLPAMHPAKRRRLDLSNSTLSKPFRSPLRVDVKKQNSLPTNLNEQSQNVNAEKHNDESSQMLPPLTAFTSPLQAALSPTRTTAALPLTFKSNPTRPTASGLSSSPTRQTLRRVTRSPEYLVLQKAHSRLLLQLSNLRKSLDTAQQALKIESSTQDADLEALVAKWRGVSREAAEELFRTAKDRVNKMGGVGAWRDKTQKRDEAWGGDQDQVGFDIQEEVDEDELSEEQRELLEGYRDEMRREKEKYGGAEEEQRKAEKVKARDKQKDDESFTMDMMLKQLNVELDVIGYDAQEQRWTE